MNRSRSAVLACLALASLCAPQGAISTAAAQPCNPAWTKEFPNQEADYIRCFLPVEENGKTVYYVGGGWFNEAGGVKGCRCIARWDGSTWSPLGNGVDYGPVWAIARFDDGSGPAIYAGGDFYSASGVAAKNIAKWDGQRWSPLGPGLNNTVRALQVWDDGTGSALYAAGFFTPAAEQPGWGVAKWDGKQWHALGIGLLSDGIGRALTVFKVGGREQLILGGRFLYAGGVPVWDIAAWDGRTWSAFGPPHGDGPGDHTVTKFGLIDLGSGASLYAVGQFGLKSNPDIRNIARWTGRSWEPVGAGVGEPYEYVSSIARFDPGDGPRIVVGGYLDGGYAVWDGATWTDGELPDVIVRALAPIDTSSGPELLVGGGAEGGRWDGSRILPGLAAAGPSGHYVGSARHSLARLPTPEGPRVFLSGNFLTTNDIRVNGCASYGADGWRPTGVADGDRVEYLATFDDGSGLALFGTGDFPSLDKNNKSRLVKWNGQTWDLVTAEPIKGPLYVHDDGTGPALYTASATPQPVICKWDGAAWTKLPAAFSEGEIRDFTSFDDGSGPSLIVAGTFLTVDGKAAGGIARWDGVAWHTLGIYPDYIEATAVVDGQNGTLFVGANTKNMTRVLAWKADQWSILGSFNGPIQDLMLFDVGLGPKLYAAGGFGVASGTPAPGLARWSGKVNQWTQVLGGLWGSSAYQILSTSSAEGHSLWVCGGFSRAGTIPSSHIARWDTCPSCAPDFDKSDTLDIDDFIAFQAAFAAGDPRADFTGDGELDTDDFLAFSVAFGAGCP